MKNLKLFAANFSSPVLVRVLYVLLAILAMALAGGAPDAFGGN